MAERWCQETLKISDDSQHLELHKSRCNIVRNIIDNCENDGNHSEDRMRALLQTGWDVNENLPKYDQLVFHSHTTALHEAVRQGWTAGVKMLLDAGAKCMTSDVSENPLNLALQKGDCPHIYGKDRTPFVKLLLDHGAECESDTMPNPLTLALQKSNCDPDIIELLLKHGADPNHHTTDEDVPLIQALVRRNRHISRIVQLLLDHGANPKIMHKFNVGGNRDANLVHRYALEHNIKGGLSDIAKMVPEAGARLTSSDTSKTLLALALQNHNCPPDLIELLLKAGVDPNAHDNQFENIPLLSAIDGWNPQGILLLLKHGANTNVTHRIYKGTHAVSRTALHVAVKKGSTNILKILLEAGAKVDTEAFNEAIKQRSTQVVKDFLFFGAKADTSALKEAVRQRSTELMMILLEAGAEADTSVLNEAVKQRSTDFLFFGAKADTSTELMMILLDASTRCAIPQITLTLALENYAPPDLIDLLLKHCADPYDHDDDAYHNIHIFCAIKNCRHDLNSTLILRLLLTHGANPNATHMINLQDKESQNRVTRTVLHEAAAQGWTEGVRMLLVAGAKCKMDASENPLMLALLRNNCSPELIELLLKNGADPNHNKTGGDFPISLALKNNLSYSRIVPLLLEYGANPNVTHSRLVGMQRKLHRVPIHEAIELAWTEGVKMLLDAGAECSGLGALGSPLMLALQNHQCQAELIDLLLKHGAGAEVGGSVIPHMLSWYMFQAHELFPRHLLDFFFLHGGNINIKDNNHRTPLEFSVMHRGHSNIIRWLIRHGAEPLPHFSLLKGYFVQSHGVTCPSETPLILLQAGMRLSPEAQRQLQNMEVALSVWLQDNNGDGGINHEEKRQTKQTMLDMWDQLEKERLQGLQHSTKNSKKSTFPEYWSQQMEDLQEFSDNSLNVYPEDAYISPTFENRQGCQQILNQIHRVLDFLSQPQSLQWYCRCCVRENLVSLQPSVMKSLPVPYMLKCYILCHEI